jgi:hypothetical protein
MIEVELTFNEWLVASTRGCERQIDGAMRRRHPGHGSPDKRTSDGWFWNINGAAGEACVAKWLGVPWDGCFGDLDASDVAFLEVRTTTGHDYPLRLHDDDKDGRVYVLVASSLESVPRGAFKDSSSDHAGSAPSGFMISRLQSPGRQDIPPTGCRSPR